MINDLDLEKRTSAPSTTSIATIPEPRRTESSDSKTRNEIANFLLLLLAVIIFVAFSALFLINYYAHAGDAGAGDAAKRLMDLMNIVFGPVVTLFSSVVGFYFGARTAQEGTNAPGNQPNPAS